MSLLYGNLQLFNQYYSWVVTFPRFAICRHESDSFGCNLNRSLGYLCYLSYLCRWDVCSIPKACGVIENEKNDIFHGSECRLQASSLVKYDPQRDLLEMEQSKRHLSSCVCQYRVINESPNQVARILLAIHVGERPRESRKKTRNIEPKRPLGLALCKTIGTSSLAQVRFLRNQ